MVCRILQQRHHALVGDEARDLRVDERADLHDAAGDERRDEVAHHFAHGSEAEVETRTRSARSSGTHDRELHAHLQRRTDHRRPAEHDREIDFTGSRAADRSTQSAPIIATFQNTGATYDRKNLRWLFRMPRHQALITKMPAPGKQDPREPDRERARLAL